MIDTSSERGNTDSRSRRQTAALAPEQMVERRELLRRLLNSSTFARSERLGAFLTYVCDMALNGQESELNEQLVGSAVFGRSPDYDSSIDGIVRSQASRLRQRLDLYFEHEGAGEALRVTIPRGGYVPVFERREARTTEEPISPETRSAETLVPSAVLPQQTPAKARASWLPWVLSLVLAVALGTILLREHRQAAQPDAAQRSHPLWSRLFTQARPTTVVAPDSGLVIFHGFSSQEVGLKQYLDAGYRTVSNDPLRASTAGTPQSWLLDLANRRYTSMVDVEAMLVLKDKARNLGSEVSVRYARDLRPNDLKNGSAILLGMSSANPWVELFERDMNFVLKDDFTKNFWVVNRKPKNGEPSQWLAVRSDPLRKVFGVVAFVPNLSHDGDTLLIEGISMSGTEAAMDFVTDDAQLLPFLAKIHRSDGSIPHFEVLLETHNMGASAVQSQLLAWRTMD